MKDVTRPHLLALLILAGRVASADPVDLVVTSDKHMQIVVTSAPTPTDVVLWSDRGGSEPALSVRARIEPITIALVVSAWSQWIGRDELPPPDARFVGKNHPGALSSLKRAIDDSGLAKSNPFGSKRVVVLYGNRIEIRHRDDLELLRGQELGEQSAYERETGQLLLQSISVALDQLHAAATPRKAMIVFGDGFDDNVSQLSPAALAQRARDEQVSMFAILWRPPQMELKYTGGDPEVVAEIVPSPIRAQPAEFTTALRTVIAQLPVRYDVVFDGARMPWDGLPHRFEVRSGSRLLGVVTATLPAAAGSPPVAESRSTVLPYALLGLGLVGLAAGVVSLRARRSRRRRARG